MADTTLIDTRFGPMVVPLADTVVGRSLRLYGAYTEAESALLCRAVPCDAVILDIGANVGSHALAFAAAVPTGRVIALEPQPKLFDILAANIAMNGSARIEAIRAAAGREVGSCRVADIDLARPTNFGLYSLKDVDGGTATPVITIDSLGLDRLDLIKCDVEGMETEVLMGAAATIARRRPILYVENDRRHRSADLVGWMLAAGYRIWWHTPRYFTPDNWRGCTDDVFDGLRSLNLLGLPTERADDLGGLWRGLVEIRKAASAWPPIILA